MSRLKDYIPLYTSDDKEKLLNVLEEKQKIIKIIEIKIKIKEEEEKKKDLYADYHKFIEICAEKCTQQPFLCAEKCIFAYKLCAEKCKQHYGKTCITTT
mgnify:CR=1 FL=1